MVSDINNGHHLEQGIPVDVIYLDFRKAFDSVPHERLLLKLRAYGIHSNIFEWVKPFLSLLLIYINDVISVVKSPALFIQLLTDKVPYNYKKISWP